MRSLARSGQARQFGRDRASRSRTPSPSRTSKSPRARSASRPPLPAPPLRLQVNAAGTAQRSGRILATSSSARIPVSGAVVRLRDVARVELGALQYSSSAFFGKDPTVVLAIFQMPGSNALDLQAQVKSKMELLSKHFPPGIEYAIHYDTTRFVSAAMRDVVITLIEALLLVVFVVYLFLQSWRTTIIPTIAIPVSLIATLAVMQICGFSLNMLSLLGMVLAIGLVVDDAIVVVENVERQLEAGLPPLEAARKSHVGGDRTDHRDDRRADGGVRARRLHPRRRRPALQPVRADGRDLRRHFRLQFADAQPRLERRAAAPHPAGQVLPVPLVQRRLRRAGAFLRALRQGLHPVRLGADRRVRRARGRRLRVVAQHPSTFLPVEDQGYFFVMVQLPDGAALQRTDEVALKVRDILQATPGVEIAGFISGLNFLTNAAQSNSAVEFAVLKPWSERGPSESASALVAAVSAETARNSRSVRAELRSALDQRARHDRRVRVPGRGSHGARQRARSTTRPRPC